MYPLECLQVPPGVHVPPFENHCTRVSVVPNPVLKDPLPSKTPCPAGFCSSSTSAHLTQLRATHFTP